MYKDHDVVSHVIIKRMTWTGQVLQREQGFHLKNVGSGKTEGRRQLGRPKHTYMRTLVEMDGEI